MKKYLIILIGVLLFANNEIKLNGSFIGNFINPFKNILEKSQKNICIYSAPEKIKLPISSNKDTNSYMNISSLPKEFILDNKSVEEVVKNYYSQEYQVKSCTKDKADLIVNVLGGNVYVKYDESMRGFADFIDDIEVTLKIEIIKKGKRYLKTLRMDGKLGKKNTKDYSLSITSDDENHKIAVKDLKNAVKKIIEFEILTALEKVENEN